MSDRLGDDASFAVTYGDTMSDIDLAEVRACHERHGWLATLVATDLPTRFRVVGLRYGETTVRGFAAKPVLLNDHINGGFYFFRREALSRDYWAAGAELETTVLEGLVKEQQLEAFPFRGGVVAPRQRARPGHHRRHRARVGGAGLSQRARERRSSRR